MDYGQSPVPRPGDTWAISVGGDVRFAKVIRPGDAPGWWLCREEGTGTEFSAPEGWLIVRLDSD